MKTNYFYESAKDCGLTLKEYLGQTEYNYVIVEGDKVVLWKDNDCPVIFGDYADALAELGCWVAPVRNVSIITEKEMLETYCKKDYEMALDAIEAEAEGGVMESHAHDEELVRKINDAWDKNKEGFYIILCALYKRDIGEITDSDAFRLPQWENTAEYVKGQRTGDWSDYEDMALKNMELEWDFFATNYLEHIADDADLECIINFLHYPYLPIYK